MEASRVSGVAANPINWPDVQVKVEPLPKSAVVQMCSLVLAYDANITEYPHCHHHLGP